MIKKCQGVDNATPPFWGNGSCARPAKFGRTVNRYQWKNSATDSENYKNEKLNLCAIHKNQLKRFRARVAAARVLIAKMRDMPNSYRCQWRLLEARCNRAAQGRAKYGKRVCDRHRDSIFQVKDKAATWVGGEVSSDHLAWVGKVVRGIHRTTGYYPVSIKFRKGDGGMCWAKRHISVPSKGGAGRRILLHEIAHGLAWRNNHDADFYRTLFKLGKRWLSGEEQIGLVEDEVMYKPQGAKAAARRMRIRLEEEDVKLPSA
ncbi:hypothetical protein UFOVP1336_3 [uncultured Caudovirales phage]|uniref:Uncharacterized protein n=1 Tax=uncultured Caudovirales phage TaxID=2100421 RepID=A0A6J5RYV8_9CAUD|nr:hypothetical protein UFOVP1336_3 [uncultured Caudovirales phage]